MPVLYPTTAAPIVRRQRRVPDRTKIREELALRDHQVTLSLLWTEYKAEHFDGYQYSQFVDLYCRFEKKLSSSSIHTAATCSRLSRQHHRAGQKVFVDFWRFPRWKSSTVR